MGRLADHLWWFIEATYGWGFDLHVIGDPQTSILRLGIRRHWGPPLGLPDGTLIRRGGRIAELHFRSEVMAALQAGAPGPVRALATMRARGLDGLLCLAKALEKDPVLKDTEAFFGETLLWHTIGRLGFWAIPVRGRVRRWVVSTFQCLVLRHYSPAGWARLKRLGATESRVVWISRAQLLRLYGPGSNPLRQRHPAPRRTPAARTPRLAA